MNKRGRIAKAKKDWPDLDDWDLYKRLSEGDPGTYFGWTYTKRILRELRLHEDAEFERELWASVGLSRELLDRIPDAEMVEVSREVQVEGLKRMRDEDPEEFERLMAQMREVEERWKSPGGVN